ncbi:hypothetical protein AXX17_AT3G30010 [Arabidopsis thaliana]|uniref:DC1 domain-containing protein n=1 Tax=Arabidopsis thaliana TaxID=3702 RepID=A0A178V9X3_ARATH|nr:hypothetical protein AXX17_AT3G30010 [Arabidopsis thaliana]
MDTATFPIFKFRGHAHDLFIVNSHFLQCAACDRRTGVGYGVGYICNECDFSIHHICAFLFNIPEIFDHPSHDGHCLKLLTTGAPHHTDPNCHLCASKDHLLVPWHHHPVQICYTDICEFCKGGNELGCHCLQCGFRIHVTCVPVFDSPEITHPSHVRHPLKLLTDGAPNYTDPRCHICGEDTQHLLYHCDICKFNLDLRCAAKSPPPIALSNLKATVLLTSVQCDFMIFHQKCAQLPRVIHVNHHDHRVSYKYPLGPGEWRCGVYWEEIDWSYGAYSCSLCPNYAIHSLCATRKDVWDGKELDGVPEEVEDIEPFKRNDDNTITHFAHEHNLISLRKDGEEGSICGACVCPISSYTFYKCSRSDCSFILHETCANLRMKKRHFLSPEQLVLSQWKNNDNFPRWCDACLLVCSEGFVYGAMFDLVCSSIDVPFIHGSHPHHLLYLKLQDGHFKTCQSCGIDHTKVVVGCVKCNYFLDFHCATLPLTVSLPRYDDHPLTLCYGEKASGKYWCDICERETNPETWFYTGLESGVTLHILCVLGDISNEYHIMCPPWVKKLELKT